jgi:hypothetical protein
MGARVTRRRLLQGAAATGAGLVLPGRVVPGRAAEDGSGRVVRRNPILLPTDRRPTQVALRAGAKLRGKPRKIKWIGDPPAVKGDGWRVHDWTYENSRVIALHGFAERIVEQGSLALDGRRLSRTYVWGRDNTTGIIDVDPADAEILLANSPTMEWVDVTDEPRPDLVCHKPIVVGPPPQRRAR